MLNAYPRPQLVRDSFFNLNGTWDFTIGDAELPTRFDMQVNIPYPPESKMSGIGRRIQKNDVLWYRRRFSLPEGFLKERLLLHFGAVDQCAEVFLNGERLGAHEGGYLPFTFDISSLLKGENELIVKATDPLDHAFPWGKQKQKNGGMWYTPFSGIWQTVWLESVPDRYITAIDLQPTLDSISLSVHTNEPVDAIRITIETPDGPLSVDAPDGNVTIPIPSPVLWSPSNSHLYPLRIAAGNDTVSSYFALRTVETACVNGIPRLLLNGKPYFFHGVLDQGYWENGICLPDDDGGYERDVLAMKRLGFNLLRKHIRIEPLPFYHACDRLGMLVLQDFVNNGEYRFFHDTILPTIGLKKGFERRRDPASRAQKIFLSTAKQTMAYLNNASCIVGWTVFNEGWGQFDADGVYAELKALDVTRFFDATSGWFAKTRSDVQSEHVYFRKFRPHGSTRPLLLSEFGGYVDASKIDKAYGYRSFRTNEAYKKAVYALYRNEIIPAVKVGLCGAVYTQLSDVEEEKNGLLSADRKTVKVDEVEMQNIASALAAEMN